MPGSKTIKFFDVYEAYGLHQEAPSETVIRTLEHEYEKLAGNKTLGAKGMRRRLSGFIAIFENNASRVLYDGRFEFHKHVNDDKVQQEMVGSDFESLFPYAAKREVARRNAPSFGEMLMWFYPPFYAAVCWQAAVGEMQQNVKALSQAEKLRNTAFDEHPFTPGRPLSRDAWHESCVLENWGRTKVDVSP